MKLLFFAAVLLLGSVWSFAQTTTNVWIGTTNQNWNYALNWSRGVVPSSSDLVLFGSEFGGSDSNAWLNANFAIHTLIATNYTGQHWANSAGVLDAQLLVLSNQTFRTPSEGGVPLPTWNITTAIVNNSTFNFDGSGSQNPYPVVTIQNGFITNAVFRISGRWPSLTFGSNVLFGTTVISIETRGGAAGSYSGYITIPTSNLSATNVWVHCTGAGASFTMPLATVNYLVTQPLWLWSSVQAMRWTNTTSLTTRGLAFTANRMVLADGTFSASNSTVIIEEELRLSGSGLFNPMTSTVQFNVSTNEATCNVTNFHNVVFSRPSKTVTLTNTTTRILGRLAGGGSNGAPVQIRAMNGGTVSLNLTNRNDHHLFFVQPFGLNASGGLLTLGWLTYPSTNVTGTIKRLPVGIEGGTVW